MIDLIPTLRHEGDPRIIEAGPSSLTPVHSTAKALGWLSIALGMAELLGARRLGQALGLDDKTGLIRAFGIRELAAGVTTLSTEKVVGLWSRSAGDVLDLLLLGTALDGPRHHQRRNAKLAFAAVAAITAVDVMAARSLTQERRRDDQAKDYRDRTGFPNRGRMGAGDIASRDDARKRASA